ncbi:MAG: molybdenum cofactor guanylyltransferase [Limisphaerales bacterium]
MSDSPKNEIHACILAGGLSSRMGEEKAGMMLGRRTLLQIAERKVADWPCMIIREDVVPRCGPIGGIITGFAQCEAERILFLPCDMPFVSSGLLQDLANEAGACADQDGLAGFPMVISRSAEPTIRELHARDEYSLQRLVRELDLKRVACADPGRELFNINTPEDFEKAKRISEAG